ncbi:osmoprotectant transport system ATP-binding protein [Paraburkholderia diazotrophica]|uniref:Osmoprotectant transport system ATP-binding protein n=1 Tax=Paraburkholderia diazotrophica TaxID=667676 RepID=A0A1H7DVG5_9BURK|nr:osmoprotectant transport system ATP-binding protein [Paraburkholderia diazotrophica]
MIELDQLTKTFTQKDGQQVHAVDSVSLTVDEGEICVFLGPSGCRKTTTLKMINRLIEPTSGRVLINGEDTGTLNQTDLRRHIGYVIQQIGCSRTWRSKKTSRSCHACSAGTRSAARSARPN